jgi:hypothetical protein
VLGRFLEVALLEAQGFQTAGVPIEIFGEIYNLKARLEVVFTDGDGHRSGLQWRGASSLRCCFRHSNVLMLGSDLAHRRPGFFEIDHSNPADFKAVKRAELFDDVDSLVEGERLLAAGAAPFTRAAFNEMAKATGLSATAHGLLANTRLRPHLDPVRQFQYDWVHTCLQEGQMSAALQLFAQACETKAEIPYTWWCEYLQHPSWRFPSQNGVKMKALHRIFNEHRTGTKVDAKGEVTRAERKVKPRSAELLGLYGLLRHAVETKRFPAEVGGELEVFLAACRVVDVLLGAKRRRIALAQAAQLLRAANTDYITKHKALYGSQHIKPKTHWLYDIADQMGLAAEERGEEAVLLDAFVVERIHLEIKMYAADVHHGTERTVLERTTVHKLNRLEKAVPNELHDHLVGPLTQLSPTLPLTARACEIATCTYSRGDVVFGNASDGTEAAIVIACTIQAGQVYLICDQLTHLRAYSRASVLLDTSNVRRNVWCARACRPALAWYMVRADHMVAILEF